MKLLEVGDGWLIIFRPWRISVITSEIPILSRLQGTLYETIRREERPIYGTKRGNSGKKRRALPMEAPPKRKFPAANAL